MEEYLVSIIIPVYNMEKYLSDCLESVVNQTYKNLEIICVDDASTDHSVSVLEKYANRDARIQIIKNEKNGGLSFSRNKGFERARGKYTYYLDSDDCLKENAIEKLYGYAEEYDTDAIYFNSSVFGEVEIVGKGPCLEYGLRDISKKVYDGPALFKILYENHVYVNSVWRRFWKTEFLVDNDLKFESSMRTSEDEPFSVRAILCGKRMMMVDEVYHVYRRREGSISTGAGRVIAIDEFRGYCILLDFWRKHQFTPDINDVLRRYLNRKLITVKRVYMRNKDAVSKEDFKDGIGPHLFEVLILQEYEHFLDSIDESAVKKIKSFKYVLVYGAHIYASEVVEMLERKKIGIDSLAVTRMHEKAEGINGIPVHAIKDLCYMKDDAIVVLGVGKSNREDVITTLGKYGFMNYIALD